MLQLDDISANLLHMDCFGTRLSPSGVLLATLQSVRPDLEMRPGDWWHDFGTPLSPSGVLLATLQSVRPDLEMRPGDWWHEQCRATASYQSFYFVPERQP